MFAKRMLPYESLEFAYQFGVSTKRKVGVDARFYGDGARLIQTGNLRLRKIGVADVRKRVAAPQLECVVEERPSFRRVAVAERFEPEFEQRIKVENVDGRRVERQCVPRSSTLDELRGSERASQRRHLSLQRVRAARRLVIAPNRVDQRVVGDDLTATQCERGEQRPEADTSDRRISAVVGDDFERAEQADLHERTLRRRRPRNSTNLKSW
jgi:hypothetical protein